MKFTKENIIGLEFTEKYSGNIYRLVEPLGQGDFGVLGLHWNDGKALQNTEYTLDHLEKRIKTEEWKLTNKLETYEIF